MIDCLVGEDVADKNWKKFHMDTSIIGHYCPGLKTRQEHIEKILRMKYKKVK